MLKKRLTIVVLLVALVLTLTACFPGKRRASELLGTDKLPTRYSKVTYIENFYSLPVRAGYADYIFVGYAEEYLKTEHNSLADTFYSLKVIENIKGELRKDVGVETKKSGGIAKYGTYFELIEKDILPKIGEYYIFLVRVAEGNIIYASGINTNLWLRSGLNYKNDAAYEKVVDAYKNQEIVHQDWERYISKDDVNFVG